MPEQRKTLFLSLVGMAMSLSASPLFAAGYVPEKAWRFGAEIAGVSRASASIDKGGEISRDSVILRLAANKFWTDKFAAGISFGYEYDRYKFSGDAGFGLRAPWENVRSVRLSVPLRYQVNDSWNAFILPTLRFKAEEDADLGEGREQGLLAAAGYRFSDRLTLGPGLGVFSEIGGGSDVFPILLIDWKITDTVSVETGRGLAASRGPGVTLRWRPAGPWMFTAGARYEKQRFRLADNGSVSGGIGEEKTVPLAVGADYAFSRKASLSLLTGFDFAGRLRVENDSGDITDSSDFDTTPFYGGVFSYRF